MRKFSTHFALVLLAVLGFSTAFAGSGGPDTYGYTWRDSNEPNGPAYVWNDITTKVGAVQITGLADDNAVGPYNIGWDFHYYWIDVDNFKFGSNGWIGLGSQGNIGNIAHCFPAIPTAGGSGDNFIAPFMTDLNYLGGNNMGEAWYWSNNTDSLVIQYNNVPWWVNANPDFTGSNTFQVILSGVDSSITFMYNDMDPAAFNDITTCAQDLEIGIENLTGNIGLEVFNETVPGDQFAVKFYYPAVVTFQVPDATPAWNANSDNAGQIIIQQAGSPITTTLEANIGNVGNSDITNSIDISGNLQTLSFSSIWTGNESIAAGLVAGTDSTVTFSSPATITNPGQHYYNVSTTNSQDINFSNNNNTVEVSVLECANDTVNLTYATGNAPDAGLAWGGGGQDGGAVYFSPDQYPITIEAIDMFILGDDGDPATPMVTGFWMKIYDDTGLPGALLDSIYVGPSQAIEDNWNRLVLSSPQVISSGGFYVAWLQESAGVALGTEAFGPISRRTYEILGGQWAPYRSITTVDYLVSVHASGCTVVGVEDAVSSLHLEAYPNPTSSLFKVRFDMPVSGTAVLNMSDLTGRTIFNRSEDVNAGANTFTYDASELANGTYFLNFDFNGERVTKKIVVAH